MRELTYIEATREALAEELEVNADLFIVGQDVGAHGGIFGTTLGLQKRFGADRVREFAAFERGMVGFAIGAALAGARPVIDLTFVDYLLYGLGELAQHVAALPVLSSGDVELPIVLRACIGPGLSSGPFHSGNYHSCFAQIPGLQVAAPSSPREGKGMLKASLRSSEPVLLLEHKSLFAMRGSIPEEDYISPLDRSVIARAGSDATLVSYGGMMDTVLNAAGVLSDEGVSIEIIDLRMLAPLDVSTVLSSVARTGRLMIVDDAYGHFGVSAEIAAQVSLHALDYLDAPILRLHSASQPPSYSPALESSFAPTTADVIKATRELIKE